MYISTEKKKALFKKHNGTEVNTGSPEGQIALFTEHINHLTLHLQKNKKDHATELSLVRLVGRRKRLLNFLKRKNIERYRSLIKELDIRK